MNKTDSIERELRYVLTSSQYDRLVNNLSKYSLNRGYCVHETTAMYDNPNPELTFYSQRIDGRLRLRTCSAVSPRILKSAEERELTLLTWKQRLENNKEDLRAEREIEISIDQSQTDSLIELIEGVLCRPRISSYERIRETILIDGIEVAVDEFPYGYVVELEIKDGSIHDLERVKDDVIPNGSKISHLSCDDLYQLLCDNIGAEAKKDIRFADDDMPKIDSALDEDCVLTR